MLFNLQHHSIYHSNQATCPFNYGIRSTIINIAVFALTLSALPATAALLKNDYSVDFMMEMSHSNRFSALYAENNANWQHIKNLFERAIKTDYDPAQFRIPRKFHLIWLGSAVPQHFINLKKRLEALHPNAPVTIWTDKEALTYPMRRRDCFTAATNMGEKSDIFRYEILYNEGGVYIDGDFEVLQPFDTLLSACDIFAGLIYNKNVELANGLIGTVPKNPIIFSCLKNLKAGGKNHAMAIIDRSGPFHFTRNFLTESKAHPELLALPLPVTFFYAWSNDDKVAKIPAQKRLKKHSIAYHLWHVSWNGSHKKHQPPAIQLPANYTQEKRYICGDSWLGYADFFVTAADNRVIPDWRKPNHVNTYKPIVSFRPHEVFCGATIYVATYCLDYFAAFIHPQIANPYTLITWGSGDPTPGKHAHLLDSPHLIAWFANHPEYCSHPKFIPMPLGKENNTWRNNILALDKTINKLSDGQINKKGLLYLNCTVRNNPAERAPLYEFCKANAFCTTGTRANIENHLAELASYFFVLSPHGNELDCHRTWEALMLSTIPVVKTSSLDQLYDNLPVVIVNNWNEVTPERLEHEYETISNNWPNYDWEKLYLNYWIAYVEKVKADHIITMANEYTKNQH